MELVTRLLEYKKFKELAFKMSEIEEEQSKFFARGYYNELQQESEDGIELDEDVTIFSLISAFKQVLDRMPKETFHHVEIIPISLEEQIEYILNQLVGGKQMTFFELVSHLGDKLIVVVTFIAILELIKRGELKIRQSKSFGEIWIARKSDRV